MNKKYIIGAIIITVLLILSRFFVNAEEKNIIGNDDIVDEVVEVEELEDCHVYIRGYVEKEGVYECLKTDKVIDIINKAGGIKEGGDVSLINLSKKVFDEMVIIIYSKDEVLNAKERLNSPKYIEIIKEIEKECVCLDDINDSCIKKEEDNTNSKINLNTADKDMLMTIPKIGSSKADAIMEYRKIKPFDQIEDIKNVSGIGDSTFEDIKDYITV